MITIHQSISQSANQPISIPEQPRKHPDLVRDVNYIAARS